MFRLKALPDQVFRPGEDPVEGYLGIQSSAAPHDAIFRNGVESRLLPVFLFDRHDVVVCHQDGRISLRPALPAKKKTSPLKTLQRTVFPDIWVEFRQQPDQFFKLRLLFQNRVGIGNGSAADKRKEVPDTLRTIQLDFFKYFLFFLWRCKHQRTCENDGCENQQNVENHHDAPSFTEDSFDTGYGRLQG